MKIICAGNLKTGTKSIAKALRLLGFTVYDWEEQTFDFLDHWVNVFENGTKPEVKRVYKNADAVVDIPGAFFFEEILEAFPDCKVILSERDEESWVKSFANQRKLWDAARPKMRALSTTQNLFDYVNMSYRDAALGSHTLNSTYVLRKRFRIHNDRVKSVVPPEKLLVYSVKQGWKPLCDFLGCEVPKMAFPHENIQGELADTIYTETRFGHQVKREIQRGLVVICSVLMIVVAMIVFIVYKAYNI